MQLLLIKKKKTQKPTSAEQQSNNSVLFNSIAIQQNEVSEGPKKKKGLAL